MKKFMTFLGGAIVLYFGFMLVINLRLFDSERVFYNNLYFSYNKIWGSCEVSHGTWSVKEASLAVEIPDEVNGRRVTAMGNSYPERFCSILKRGLPMSVMRKCSLRTR